MGRFVEQTDLDFDRFRCCGDEDLYPFACPECAWIMVFCYECDMLYADLNDLNDKGTEINNFETSRPLFACPRCGHPFEYFFIRDGKYKVSRERWLASGFGHLIARDSGA